MLGIFLATAVRLAIAPYVGDQFVFPTYILAVLLTGWFCGLGPAVSSLVLGLATASLLILPEGSFGDKGLVSTLFGLGLYIAVGAVGIAVSEDHRKVQRRLLDEIDRRSEAERTLREHASLLDQAPAVVRDLNERSGTSSDIDDQKRTGERLRTEKERLRLALAAGGMGTWSWDLDTDLLSWRSGLGSERRRALLTSRALSEHSYLWSIPKIGRGSRRRFATQSIRAVNSSWNFARSTRVAR